MNYRTLSLADAMRKQYPPPRPRIGWMLFAIIAALASATKDAETDGDWMLLTFGWTVAILYAACLVYRAVRANQQRQGDQ